MADSTIASYLEPLNICNSTTLVIPSQIPSRIHYFEVPVGKNIYAFHTHFIVALSLNRLR